MRYRRNRGESRANYEATVVGPVSEIMAEDLGAQRLPRSQGNTTLLVEIRDQAELQGMLRRIEAFGLVLVSVNPRDAARPADPTEGPSRKRSHEDA